MIIMHILHLIRQSHIHVCMYVFIYVCMHACVCLHTHIHKHTHTGLIIDNIWPYLLILLGILLHFDM